MKSPKSTIRKWSTEAELPRRRLDYWIGAICEGFLEMTATTPVAAAFESSLESAQLGPIGVNRVRGSAQDVYRTQTAIRRSRANYYYLLCKTNGPWSVAQNGHMARVKPGDVVLVDSRRTYEFHFPTSADTVSLELAPSWVESWLADPKLVIGRPIDGEAGWGRSLSGFVREMSPELAVARPLPAQVMIDQVGALLALASGSDPASATETGLGACGRQGADRRRHCTALCRTGSDRGHDRARSRHLRANAAPQPQSRRRHVCRPAERLPDGRRRADVERASLRPAQHRRNRFARGIQRPFSFYPPVPDTPRLDAGRVAPPTCGRRDIRSLTGNASTILGVIPGWCAAPDPESRDSGFDASASPRDGGLRGLGIKRPSGCPLSAIRHRRPGLALCLQAQFSREDDHG